MRVDMIAATDEDYGEDDLLGSFVLENGEVKIDAPEEGVPFFKEILGETLKALGDDFETIGEPVTAKSDPAGWMRGLLVQYCGTKLWASLEEE